MTTDQIEAALVRYEKLIADAWKREAQKFVPTLYHPFPDHEDAVMHVLYMIGKMREHLSDPSKIEKSMRWLGFIQGVLWVCHVATIEEMKDDNR